MEYKTLRNKLLARRKYPGTVEIDRCPLVTPGFKYSFNLSFGEDPLLKYQGGYLDFPNDFSFSTIQSCIRHQDISNLLSDPLQTWKYLGVFEMSDISGAISLHSEPDHKDLANFQIENMIGFFRELGLDPRKIYPSYSAGGKVAELTKGKYMFDFDVPEDVLSKEAFINSGVPRENLIPDRSRDTFLSLNLDEKPTGWGYRNEVNYNIGTPERPKMLDIATHEYLCWSPVYDSSENTSSKNIKGLKKIQGRFSIAAAGVERLNMAVNGLETVLDVDYIKAVHQKVNEVYGEDLRLGEALRTLHRIYSDVREFDLVLGTRKHNRRITINKCLRAIPKRLSCKLVEEILKLNCEVQPWHPNLHLGIEPLINRIEEYRSNQRAEFNR